MCGTGQARGKAKVVGGSQASAAAQAQKAAVRSKREDNAMILKRGDTYHIKFTWQGRAIWRSAHTSSLKIARQVEARLRCELALGHVGILEAQRIPTFSEF